MNILHGIFLGIVQGLTEFLPISSSAHLVLVPYLLGWQFPEEQVFPFGVLVQMGTLVAVIIYFWKDLWRILRCWVDGLVQRRPFASFDSRLGWYLILATIPAGLLGLLIKNQVEAAFNSPVATAAFLFLTAGLLLLAEKFGQRSRDLGSMKWKDALMMGVFQAASIFPGVSRSGSSMTGGMLNNLDRPAAARFSFLMSIPIMAAAGMLSVLDLGAVPNLGQFAPVIVAGVVSAAVVGYLSIRWLLAYLIRHSLASFSIYCVVLGALVIGSAYVW